VARPVARKCATNAAIKSQAGSGLLAGSGGIVSAPDLLRREMDVGGGRVDVFMAHQRLQHGQVDPRLGQRGPNVWRNACGCPAGTRARLRW